jgi:hypothetical protein
MCNDRALRYIKKHQNQIILLNIRGPEQKAAPREKIRRVTGTILRFAVTVRRLATHPGIQRE